MRIALVFLLALGLGGCRKKAAPVDASMGPTIAADADPRVVKVLDPAAVKRLRELAHPSGKGGILSILSTSRKDEHTRVDIVIEWSSVMQDKTYTTEIEWVFDAQRHISSAIVADSALAPVGPKNKQAMNAYLGMLHRQLDGTKPESDASTDAPVDPRTELSHRAESLFRTQRGLKRSDVIRELGAPTWASLSADPPPFKPAGVVDLYWQNGSCAPVSASFDAKDELSGSADGRLCLDAGTNPSPAYACTKADRSRYCN